MAAGTEVIWRLRERGPWRNGVSDLLLIAVLEECIYRQTLLALLAPLAGGIVPAALASAVCFGLIHSYFGLAGVLSKWLLGAILSAAVLAGSGLLTVILAHCILNAFAYAFARPAASRAGAG